MTSSGKYRIACIAGDGIGPEVIGEATKIVDEAGRRSGFDVEWMEYPFGASHYLETGEVLPESALAEIETMDAIFLGAIGDPRVKPGILERGILLKLRFHFDMFANLRPARQFPRVPIPVTIPRGKNLDILVVRENTEDLYMGLGAVSQERIHYPISMKRELYHLSGELEMELEPGCPLAVQIGIASEKGIRRITEKACQEASARGRSGLTLASKSNAMPHLYGFWEEVSKDEAERHGMELRVANVDALCYHLVRQPWEYNVILCPNLFGDIVSDLLAGLTGGLGVAAGANTGKKLGMFEPIHGSAPDITGTGKANPLAAIFSSSLMLSSLGEKDASEDIEKALFSYLLEAESSDLPVEMGGRALTSRVGEHIRSRIER